MNIHFASIFKKNIYLQFILKQQLQQIHSYSLKQRGMRVFMYDNVARIKTCTPSI